MIPGFTTIGPDGSEALVLALRSLRARGGLQRRPLARSPHGEAPRRGRCFLRAWLRRVTHAAPVTGHGLHGPLRRDPLRG